MTPYPEYHLPGEIIRILRTGSDGTEVLLRIRGRRFDPARPRTFFHVRAVARPGRARAVGAGRAAGVVLVLTARFVETAEGRRKPLSLSGRIRGGEEQDAIRVLGHDFLVTGEVVRHVGEDAFVLDAGVPLVVRVPEPTGLPEPGEWVEFLVQEPIVAELL